MTAIMRLGVGLLLCTPLSFAQYPSASWLQPPASKAPPSAPQQQQPSPPTQPAQHPLAQPGEPEQQSPPVAEKPPATQPDLPPEPKNLQSTEDLSTSVEGIEERLRQIQARLAKIGTPHNTRVRTTVSRARNFVRLSQQALKRDELKLAESHAERAEALLRDIKH